MTVVAIDFGTSNTVISILEPDTNTPKTLRFPNISRLFSLPSLESGKETISVVPSLVFIKNKEEIVLGEQVRSQRLGFAQPESLFKGFKRDLAADFRPPSRQIAGSEYTPEVVAETFLRNIHQQLKQLNIEATQVIFTIPVGAFERYLDWFWDLTEKLSLPQVKLVDESTAAALGYAIKRLGSVVLVVDFGGGTLDLSLIRTTATKNKDNNAILKAEVIAKSDAYVGGEDIDFWIVEDYLQQINSSREDVGEVGWQNLLELAEKLKIRLSVSQEAKESWFDEENFMSYELQLTQDKLADILENRQLLEQLRNALDEVLTTAFNKGVNKSNIEQVVLVGGSCLIPAVQQLIQSYFGKNKVKLDKPFQAVSHGALALNKLEEISDNLRHSYAIRLWEPFNNSYSYYTLFPKGTSYPCQRKETLILRVANEGQTEIRLDIGELAEISQGEVEYDSQGRMTSSHLHKDQEYRSLESTSETVCLAKLNPPGEIGKDRLAVDFIINERRVLLATITDLLTQEVLFRNQAIAKL